MKVAEAAAATREEEREAARMNKSPSDFSCQSYEMFVGGQGAPPTDGRSSLTGVGPNGVEGDYYSAIQQGKSSIAGEKMSIHSDDVDSLLGGGGGGCGGGGNISDSRTKINGRVRKARRILTSPPIGHAPIHCSIFK